MTERLAKPLRPAAGGSLVARRLQSAGERFPAAFVAVYRLLARLLRCFPYCPRVTGAGEQDGPEWLEVRPSRIPNGGNGLFVTRFCPRGTTLCEYKGTRLSAWQLLRTRDWTYIYNHRFEFWIDAQHHPGVKARYVNDNFEPGMHNVLWREENGRVYLEALRDLHADEELYVEYGADYWDNHRYWYGGRP